MGSFVGHVIPGSFFMAIALWQIIQVFCRYFSSLRKSGSPYVNSITQKIQCGRFGIVDVESKFIVISCVIGIVVETIISPLFHGTTIGINNSQHGTMYFFFGFAGFMNLILPRMKVFPCYESIVYCLFALAFAVEGLLFKFHLFGRDGLDVLLHTLLLYTIYACVLLTLCELRFRNNVIVSLARAFFIFLQGSWFCHVAFILYPPFEDPWGKTAHHGGPSDDSPPPHSTMMSAAAATTPSSAQAAIIISTSSANYNNNSSSSSLILKHVEERSAGGGGGGGGGHEEMMIVAMSFTWHMAAILMLMLFIGGVLGCLYKRKGDLDQGKMLLQEMNPANKGYTVISMDQQEEEECEFE